MMIFVVLGGLLIIGIVTLIEYHLDVVRLRKRIERDIQRDADKHNLYGNMETDTNL